jgi:hypothetical protein
MAAAAGAVAAEAAVVVGAGDEPLCKVYSDRPAWVSESVDGKGCLDAHYILGMVGLTAGYNDSYDRILSDIKAKFTEAAELAAKLGV